MRHTWRLNVGGATSAGPDAPALRAEPHLHHHHHHRRRRRRRRHCHRPRHEWLVWQVRYSPAACVRLRRRRRRLRRRRRYSCCCRHRRRRLPQNRLVGRERVESAAIAAAPWPAAAETVERAGTAEAEAVERRASER